MSASDRKEPGSSSPESESTLSSSGVVVRKPDDEPVDPAPMSDPLPRRRDSDPSYRLTPYRARFDVEMDDTAVSKVRDPSVSLVLGPSSAIRPRAKASSGKRLEAVASVALGAALGALLVVIIVLIARAF